MEKAKGPRGKYFYCIIESVKPKNFGRTGIEGSEIYTINYKELGAVVSDATNSSYELLRHGTIHQKVVEEVMKKHTVIPMRFGQAPKSEEDVKGFLSEQYLEIKKMLKKLDGKIELGVKILWKMDKIMEDIIKSSGRIRILNKQITANPEKSYGLKIELGKLVADALKTKGERIVDDAYESLSSLATERRKNNAAGDSMILNAAFLVEKEKEKEFDESVNDIERTYGDKVTIRYVLSPPYNFVTLRGK